MNWQSFGDGLKFARQMHLSNAEKWNGIYPTAFWLKEALGRNKGAQKVAAIRTGDQEEVGAIDAIWLAENICMPQKDFETGAKLYAQAWDSNPQLMRDWRHDYFLRAASCAAALSGQRRSEDNPSEASRWEALKNTWEAERKSFLEKHPYRSHAIFEFMQQQNLIDFESSFRLSYYY